jgi:hypothetical protein
MTVNKEKKKGRSRWIEGRRENRNSGQKKEREKEGGRRNRTRKKERM